MTRFDAQALRTTNGGMRLARDRQNERMKRALVEIRPQTTIGYVGSHRWWSGEPGSRGQRELPPEQWDPPVRPVPGLGYPRIFVEFDGFVFEFISTVEMLDSASVLEQRLVDPQTSRRRWYRKIPVSVKGKHSRDRAAALQREVAAAYEAQLPALLKLPVGVPQEGGVGPSYKVDIRL
jgi:hypothetical protein